MRALRTTSRRLQIQTKGKLVKKENGSIYPDLSTSNSTGPSTSIRISRYQREWMRIEAVDPHDARPSRWIFGAVSPEEIIVNEKLANRIYWYTYLLPTGNIREIARKVKVKRAEHGIPGARDGDPRRQVRLEDDEDRLG